MIKRKELLNYLDNLNYRLVFAILAGYLIISALIIGIFDGKVGEKKKDKEPVATATDAVTEEVTTEEPTGIFRPTTGYDLSEDEKNTPYILLLQKDPRWADAPYGSTGTVGEYGSGPTSLSMAIIYLTKDYNATPPRVAEFSYKNGYYMDQQGTSYYLITEGSADYGLDCEWISIDEARIKSDLDKGNIIITSVKANTFGDNPTDQYVVIYGYDSEGFFINDPLSETHSEGKWSFDKLENNMMGVFSMSLNPSYTPSASSTPTDASGE